MMEKKVQCGIIFVVMKSKKMRGEGLKATAADVTRRSELASPPRRAFAGRTVNVAFIVSVL